MSELISVSEFGNEDIFQSSKFYYLTKRLIDLILCIPLIIIFTCFLVIICPMVIYKSPGSLFYRQQRTGLKGRPFVIFKLRTMYSDQCDHGQKPATHKDPRVTIGGKILRHYSIDELPQLWNVLKGEMSLVGPRPHSVPMDHYYQNYIPFYSERFKVKPGITGLAQIEGSRGEIKLVQEMEQRILIDLRYIKQKSIRKDLMILLKTFHVVFNLA